MNTSRDHRSGLPGACSPAGRRPGYGQQSCARYIQGLPHRHASGPAPPRASSQATGSGCPLATAASWLARYSTWARPRSPSTHRYA